MTRCSGGDGRRLGELGELLDDIGQSPAERLVEQAPFVVEALVRLRTASSPSSTRAPLRARALRRSACANIAPYAPLLALTTAVGLPQRALPRNGRDAQSTAFLSWPGTEELYSGVAIRSASAPAIASRRRTAAAGGVSVSRSSL